MTVGKFVDMHVVEAAPSVNRIRMTATQERRLETILANVTDLWREMVLPVIPYEDLVGRHSSGNAAMAGKDRKDGSAALYGHIYVLGSMEEITSSVEESLISMNTILASRFVEPIRDEALAMYKRLVAFQGTYRDT
jgi:hypothetical protein